MKMYLGLDVHCKQTTFVAQNEQGQLQGEGQTPTTAEGLAAMLAQLGAPPRTEVALESGTQAKWAAAQLLEQGMKPVVIDAREVRVKARRVGQKTDRRDAFEICDGLRRGIYSTVVYQPPPAVERLRRVLSRRRHFVSLRTRETNAAKYLLRAAGLGGQSGGLVSAKAWERLLARTEAAELRPHLAMHFAAWRVAHEQVAALEQELQEALQPFAAVEQHLHTVRGVGVIVAATFIAALGEPTRFPSSGHVASYIGLVPSTYDSGERERHGRITKRGNAELRALLCEAAHHAARPDHPLQPYFARVCAKSGYRKAVVTVAHRLARILWQMWRKGEDFDVEQLNVVHKPRVLEKVVHYRLRRSAPPRPAKTAATV